MTYYIDTKWQKRFDSQKGGSAIKKKNTATKCNKVLEKTLM